MKVQLPINNEILKWARESIGLSIQDVSLKMSKEEEIIIEWEDGKSTPTYSQLEKLAYELYKRPVALFFFPEIPEDQNPKSDFRTLPDTVIADLPPEIIKLYRKARVLQMNLEELYENNEPTKQSILNNFKISGKFNIINLTHELRSFFEITIEDQFSWESNEFAFKFWRKKLEDNGIFVFKDAFRNNDFSGFCIYDSKYPIIYINNSMPIARQIFTLFHELGHLLLHLGGIDFRNKNIFNSFEEKYNNYEILCNKFANNFLVPPNYFTNENLTVSENRISELAKKYSVSREVILRNYFDLDLIDENYYKEMSEKWIDEVKSNKKQSNSGHYYYTQISYLGDLYINQAFMKYYQERISLENLSNYLNVKVKNIPTFEHFALG